MQWSVAEGMGVGLGILVLKSCLLHYRWELCGSWVGLGYGRGKAGLGVKTGGSKLRDALSLAPGVLRNFLEFVTVYLLLVV